ncbi:MAG TPA: cell envelope integrity protein TolA [Holophaga sp.]|nr:cell envelope integrity protein TolA [Holophaga sp.]
MSRDLYQLLQERARLSVMRWPAGLALSLGAHGLLLGVVLLAPKASQGVTETKVTWVSLPAAAGGVSGGSDAMEEGEQGERQRRVEEVAPKSDEKAGAVTPNAFGEKRTTAVKGTNQDSTSLGKAPVAAKGKNPTPTPVRGAAGHGGGSGIGEGSGVPGLRASGGAQGGMGLIGDLDGANFPFVWYLQQVQNRITGNWSRMSNAQGRVQIYFRIKRDGSLEGIRVDSPSGNGGLDQSALLAVKRSDPLPRLPEGFDGGTLGVRFWFSYTGGN